MATIWAGTLPYSRPNVGGMMGEAFWTGAKEKEQEEEKVFATVVQMFREATPEDQDLLASSPGWSKIVDMAAKKGIPMVPTKGGKMGFATPSKTLERQMGEQASSFPGLEGGEGEPSLPPGAAGYTARQKALEATATGEKQRNIAQSGYYTKTTNLLDPEFGLKAREMALKEQVDKGQLSQGEARVKLEQERNEIQRQEVVSQGAFRKGSIDVEWAKLNQDALQFGLKQRALAEGLSKDAIETNQKALSQYDNFNKALGAYKTSLREPTIRMADRTTAIQQIVGQYFSYKQLVNPNNPIEVAGLQGATTDVMMVLTDEVVRSSGTDSELERDRITHYLNTIQAATANGLLPEPIVAQIQQTLRVAGYGQKKGKWIFPSDRGGWFSGFIGGGP